MNILLVSECSGNALPQTRRILDQFSERRGERVWQTTITLAGLETLRRMLRQKARKNTAVACYRMYGSQTELLWIVGTASRFNEHGAVPTNRTKRDVLRAEDENTWHSRETILLLSRLAALWHDLGKACAQFQRILRSLTPERNLIRHEWISLRLFEAFVGNDEDENWLYRMANFQPDLADKTIACLRRDVLTKLNNCALTPFKKMPPLARAVGWLIVSHHRLPTHPQKDWETSLLNEVIDKIERTWNERETPQQKNAKEYWDIPANLFTRLGPVWQKEIRKCAKRFLKHPAAMEQCQDIFVLHLSRMTLMLADHRVSAQESNIPDSLKQKEELFANTGKYQKPKQTLTEHLLRVSQMCGQIAYALPALSKNLPRLAHHRGLRGRSGNPRFRWQDKAVDVCNAIRQQSHTGGVFLLNMASTGCGKTLANIRMFYALHPPEKGMRATFALGLRVLTSQTGKEYQKRLHLSDDELAIRVGGLAAQELYDLFSSDNSRAAREQLVDPAERKIFEKNWLNLAAQGQESARNLFADNTHVLFEGNMEHPVLKRILEDPQARKFLSAPIVTCTVDHLVPATESLRGGHQILPMLRLLGSDLVLDEIDDYGLEDLPAIARLIYWAGMLGCRVMISSATIPLSLAEGLFTAYREGRMVFEQNLGQHPEIVPPITCVWTDEFGTHTQQTNEKNFASIHHEFASKRAARIGKDVHRRRASLRNIGPLSSCHSRKLPQKLAKILLEDACCLHADNHTCVDKKRVSFGLIRMANIGPLRKIARALAHLDAPENICIHLLVYHSRFPLAVRRKTEEMLDRCLNRKESLAVFNEPEIQAHLQENPNTDHIFLVLASPVCEVGRDWDVDWAILEPSSMRSLIQLVGRIRRHRHEKWDLVNVLIWSHNFKGLTEPDKSAFLRPGFEARKKGPFTLNSHDLNELLFKEEYEQPDSIPRLLERKNANPKTNLTDLEHARLRHLFVPEPGKKALGAFSWWQYPQSMLTGILQQVQTFRKAGIPEIECLLLPHEFEDKWILTALHKSGETQQNNLLNELKITYGKRIDAWLKINIMEELHTIAANQDLSLEDCACRYFTLSLPQIDSGGWTFHSLLGFDKND